MCNFFLNQSYIGLNWRLFSATAVDRYKAFDRVARRQYFLIASKPITELPSVGTTFKPNLNATAWPSEEPLVRNMLVRGLESVSIADAIRNTRDLERRWFTLRSQYRNGTA